MNEKKNLTTKETFALAVQNHKKNNLRVAGELYKELLKINPNHASAHHNLGLVFQAFGDFQNAISSYQKAIEIQPDYANAHNNLGLAFQKLGELQKARSCYEKAIQINPNYVYAHNNLGVAFKELGELQKAIACYEKALKLKPDSVNAQANISNIYNSQLDNLEKATSESYKTLKMHHETSKFINQRISLYRLKHDVQQAEYLSSKNYKINGIEKFQKTGNEILERKENRMDNSYSDKKILLNHD